MYDLAGNLRYTIRQFRLSPVFTATAILTLALGIGGTTAIFSLIHSVMLRSLPVSDPAQLYRVGEGDECCVEGGPQDTWGMYSFPLFERLKKETPEFAEVTAFQAGRGRMSVRLQGKETAARPLRSEYVDGHYFSTLGIAAFYGRVFTPEDDNPSAPPVVVLSHRVWQSTYGSDPSIVGSTLVMEGHPFTVIGIAPAGFFGETLESDPPEIWVPLQQEPIINAEGSLLRQPISAWLRMIGRLRPGSSTAGMSPRLTALLRQWLQYDSGYPANWMPDVIQMLPKQVLNVIPAGAGVAVMKEEYGDSLKLLLAVCGLVLLIACSNVANLLLARGVTRRAQTAVRMAVGATPSQIVSQALLESILLAVAGALVGLLVAMAAARLLLALAFHTVHYLPISAAPSLPVLGFAFALALVTGVIFGAAPAWLATRTDPAEALHGAGRGNSDRSSLTRKTLLIVQATLSVVLVAGATMLGRSLNKLEHQDFGYQLQGRVIVNVNNPPATYTQPQLAAMYRRLEQELLNIPGVEGAGLAMYNPLTDNWGELIIVAGHPPGKLNEESGASWDRVSANYLQNFGIPIVRGRAFTAADNETTAPVAIVNEITAELEPILTRKLADIDPNLTFNSIRTMQQQVELSFDQERAVASLAGLFGMVALLLAAVGLYGVTAYTVAQKTNEIGIRMALGADRANVIRLVLTGAFTRVLIGLLLGLPLAIGAGKLLSAQLYGVSWWDPPALTVATAALTVCSFLAAMIPANRAASISPMNALRTE